MRVIGTGRDVTEERRLEEQRDTLIAEERRASEFREAFIDVISHELRTPITTILGLAQILARPGRIDDPAERASMLKDIRAESERLHRLVEDMLVLSRVERGGLQVDPEPIEPRRLLDRIVAHESEELPSITIQSGRRGPPAGRRRRGDLHRADPPQPAGQCREVHAGGDRGDGGCQA